MPGSKNLFKPLSGYSPGAREHNRCTRYVYEKLDRQFLPAFGSAALQYRPASHRLFARKKTMRAHPFFPFRLIGD